jgi:uncharacterized membrane protein
VFVSDRRSSTASGGQHSAQFASFARLWTALVIVYFGTQNLLYPQYAPGVPDQQPTSAWVPAPYLVAYVTGVILVALGIAMLFNKIAVAAITSVGIFMTLLTVALFVPDLFLSHGVPAQVMAINFVADTLLFAGTMFAVARAIAASAPEQIAISRAANS